MEIHIVISSILAGASVLTLFLAIYTYRRKNISGALPLTFIFIVVTLHMFGYSMELANRELEMILLWNHIEYLGIPFYGVLWFLLALEYSGNKYRLTPFIRILLFIIPVVTIIFRYTSSLNHLYYNNVMLDVNSVFPVLIFKKGLWYYVNVIYTSILIVISNYIYTRLIITNKKNNRKQSAVMFLASLIPWAGWYIYLVGVAPNNLDMVPIGIAISSILFMIGVLKFSVFDIVPIEWKEVFKRMEDGMIIFDKNLLLVDYNRAASSIISGLNKLAYGKQYVDIEGFDERIVCMVDKITDEDTSLKDDKEKKYNAKMTAIVDSKGNNIGYTMFLTDITKQLEIMKKLELLATTDDLTGIYNRRFLIERGCTEIERAERYKKPFSVIILDLDHFKNVNDQYGHKTGDEVLCVTAGICRENIRDIDILGRYGGEEFIILMPETTLNMACIVAERLRKKIEDAVLEYNNIKIGITSSLGVTGTDMVKEQNIDMFIRSADRALYKAKQDGRNRVCNISVS